MSKVSASSTVLENMPLMLKIPGSNSGISGLNQMLGRVGKDPKGSAAMGDPPPVCGEDSMQVKDGVARRPHQATSC